MVVELLVVCCYFDVVVVVLCLVDLVWLLVGVWVLDLMWVLVGLIVMWLFVVFGVDVLCIDLVLWEEFGVVFDMMFGKCCVGLDLC